MSLKKETVAEQTVKTIAGKVIQLMNTTARLYAALEDNKPSVKGLFKKVKKLTEEISDLAEELP